MTTVLTSLTGLTLASLVLATALTGLTRLPLVVGLAAGPGRSAVAAVVCSVVVTEVASVEVAQASAVTEAAAVEVVPAPPVTVADVTTAPQDTSSTNRPRSFRSVAVSERLSHM
ncbi:hypothetical protein [Streptomyces sp. NPDC007074]|uniref:hypothetical protein n=1 Tax=unclassified Streptomyces TaxID=2593676 RepID=UPI0033EBE39C